MPTLDQLRALEGRHVIVHLAREAGGPVSVTGRLLGLLEAADGVVATIEPDDRPGTRQTIHSHHIVTARAV